MSANNCGGCGQPSTNKCAGCKLQHYCGQDCQKKHWAKHKLECKDLYIEHALKRVAHILHEAHLKFRENTWDRVIDKVVTTPDEIRVYLGMETDELPIKFQHGLMDDEESKMAVLTNEVHGYSTAVLHDLLESLLKDLNVNAEEVTVGLKTIPRPTRMILPNGAAKHCLSDPEHDLILLKSKKTGKQWVFDICGSQFGFYEPLWKFEDYSHRCLRSIHSRRPLDLSKWLLSEAAKLKGYEYVRLALGFEASISLHEEAKLWEIQHIPLAQLPTLPEDQFVEIKASLLQSLDLRVQNFFHSRNFNERLRSALAYEVEHPEQSQLEQEQFGMRMIQKKIQLQMRG